MNIDLSVIAQGVTIVLVAWAIKGIHNINGSVKSLMQWKDDHTKKDDERHNTVVDWLKQIDRRKD